MANCLRCGMQNVLVHTCKPSKVWSNGFKRGEETMLEQVTGLIAFGCLFMTDEMKAILIKKIKELGNKK